MGSVDVEDGPVEKENEQQQGPGAAHSMITQMEDFLDKIKLLGYDKDFLKRSSSYKPLSRNYFAHQTNTGEQFFMFTNTAAWLIQKASKNTKFEMPQEHDDPNATISKILDETRQLEVSVDFPPNKLKTGSGEHCIMVLDKLSDVALKNANFSWHKPSPVKDEITDVNAPTTDESELTAEQFDDEPEIAEDDDEEEFLDLEGLKHLSMKQSDVSEERKEILQSGTDAAEWKLEVERVTPSLKVTIRQDAKDWRNHLEQMQQYRSSIDDTLKQAQSQLERLSSEIGKNMEKIQSREKYLNTQLESILSQFRSAQDRLAEVKEKYKEASGGVTERSRNLAQITEELDQTKQDLEERGLSLTDGAPLVKVKQALTKLQQEMIAVDVEIGVIEQSLLQAQLRDRTHLHNNMHSASTHEYVY